MRKCSICHTEKEISEFYIYKGKHSYRCKFCENERAKAMHRKVAKAPIRTDYLNSILTVDNGDRLVLSTSISEADIQRIKSEGFDFVLKQKSKNNSYYLR